MNIEIEAKPDQLMAMAEVLKRIGYTDIRKLSASDQEAYDAQYALEQVRQALNNNGYNPR